MMPPKKFTNLSLKTNLWEEIEKIAVARHSAPTTIINQVLWNYVDQWKFMSEFKKLSSQLNSMEGEG